VLILGWLLLGIALLAIEAGLLSLGAQQGKYVSIVGALKYNILGATQIPFSTWPWGQESIAGALESAFTGEAKAVAGNVSHESTAQQLTNPGQLPL
jgi:hypothetical protein